MKPWKIEAPSLPFFYGWVIVGVGIVSMAFWFGIRASFSVFYVALLEEFSWSRGETAGIQSMSLITYTFIAPAVGGLIDRFGPRRIIIPGILVLASGLILCSSIHTIGQFYLIYGVIVATGVTSIAIVSYSAILAHWFEKKRGLANGLAVSGMGLGTFIFVPFSQQCISFLGWRLTFIIIGGLVILITLPLNAFLLRHKPQDLGSNPDGDKRNGLHESRKFSTAHNSSLNTDWDFKSAYKTGRFWYLMAFPFLAVIVVYIVLVHHVKFLIDQGMDKSTAAFVFGVTGIISLIFRIFWGWLSDSIGRETTYTIGSMCIFFGVISLVLIEISGNTQFVYPFIFFFGSGWGVTAPMFMSAAADLFKGKSFGLIYGILEGVIGIGGALGAWLPGFIFDRTQSYLGAFYAASLIILISCLFIWLAAPRKVNNKI